MRAAKYTCLFLTLSTSALQAQPSLTINGKPAAHPILEHAGRRYVDLEDLRAAGAQVTSQGNDIKLRFGVEQGGTGQIQAVAGGQDEWLFNGIWRLQVGAVSPIVKPFSGTPGTPGWGILVEIRNGAKKEVSLQQTGAQPPTLALQDGSILKCDEGEWQTVCFRPLLPGAALKTVLKFYFPHGTTQTIPASLVVLPIDPSFGLLRDTGLRYSVAAPSFRVKLSNSSVP